MSSISFAGDLPNVRAIISPGIKLGYIFGENGGFTYGFEISIIFVKDEAIWNYGGVVGVDYSKSFTKAHIGAELFFIISGIDIGPTWLITKEGNVHYGYSITTFVGLLAYPYFSFTNVSNMKSIYEGGGYGKFHIFNSQKKGWFTLLH